jgi:hypothetical protein
MKQVCFGYAKSVTLTDQLFTCHEARKNLLDVYMAMPKKENAIQIQQYRPICLLNVSFKIFTKVANNRILKVAHKVVRPSQTAFMPGRHILEGVVVLHETIHEIHIKKLDGVLLKINFEKAYDKVN